MDGGRHGGLPVQIFASWRRVVRAPGWRGAGIGGFV
jgi:hypothetical protein